MIYIRSSYQGSIDFGPWIEDEKRRHVKIGESFADQFSLGVKDIQKDEKAVFFITSLYKHLEGTEENCLETQKCKLSINPQGNYILFNFPKMTFLFGNNERRNLIQVAITNDNKSGCFKQPFDLLRTRFLCGGFAQVDSGKVVKLGDSYKETVETSGIRSSLPITYGNMFYFQLTEKVTLGWQRKEYEKKLKSRR